MGSKALNYLGIMRKAGACAVGETDCGATCRAGKAKVLLVASDASENARSRARGFVYGRGIPLVELPFAKFELAGLLGRGMTAMIAVTDLGLAEAFMRTLAAEDPREEYVQTAARLAERLEAEKQRKKERQAHQQNRRFGKRRKQT